MKKTALVIGDSMRDIYLHVTPKRRVNPEDPGVPLRNATQMSYAGGAGNLASNLTKLGWKVHSIYGYGMIRKYRVIDDGVYTARFDVEDDIKPITIDDVSFLPHFDALFFSDYNKGSVAHEVIDLVASKAKISKVPIYVDCKNFSLYKQVADYAFPNKSEYKKNKKLYDAFDGVLVKKLSEHGVEIFRQRKRVAQWPSMVDEVVNVCGAGDTVMAAFATALHDGKSDKEAAKFAMHAAAIATMQQETYAPSLEEVNQFMNSTDQD